MQSSGSIGRKACRPDELVRLGKADAKLREAIALVEKAYDVVKSDDRLAGLIGFNCTVGWDGAVAKRIQAAYEADFDEPGADPSPFLSDAFRHFGLAEPFSASMNAAVSCKS